MAYTPRTLRRRKLLHGNTNVDPELVSLYHDEPILDDASPPPLQATSVNHNNRSTKMTLGTPTKNRRQTDIAATSTPSFPNIYAPSLSLAERLNNKRTSVIDLKKYDMVPNQMKLALSATAQELFFARDDFFMEPNPPSPNNNTEPSPAHASSTMPSQDQEMTPPSPPPAGVAPASPTLSVISAATSISETMDISLISWPASPMPSSPTFRPASALSFGRVAPPTPLQLPSSSPSNNNTHPPRVTTERLMNPFLEPTSTPSPRHDSPSPQQQVPIPLSTRMLQRFPHHAIMFQGKKQQRPLATWQITDLSSSPPPLQSTTTTTTTSTLFRQHRDKGSISKKIAYRRRRLAIAKRVGWLVESVSPT